MKKYLIAGDNMRMPFRLGAIATIALMGALGNAFAETTTDVYGKELKIEPARNMFARFGVLGLHLNNKSEAAKDVSGPVLAQGARGTGCPRNGYDDDGNLLPACDPGNDPRYSTIYGSNVQTLLFGPTTPPTTPSTTGPFYTGVDTLGIPDDVRANFSDSLSGAVGTLGMYFDEDHHWAVEVPVMATPFNIKVDGAGAFQQAGQIISAKALGLLVFGHYYFGEKNDKFRPSVSLTANYLLPFDVQATSSLERWTGGKTKISSSGSLGLGFMVGGKYAFNDRWDFNFNVGQFKAKINSTLTTYDTILTANSPIFTYWPGALGQNIRGLRSGGLLAQNLQALIDYRNSDPANRVNGGANLGNFVRTQSQTLDPYIFLVSVGYNF